MAAPQPHAALVTAVLAAAGPLHSREHHGELVVVDTDRAFATATAARTVLELTPHNRTATAANIARRDCAIIDALAITINPGPRSISKVITISGVWVPSDWGNVTTMDQMAMVPGFKRVTFGGPLGLTTTASFPLGQFTPPILKSRICGVTPKFIMLVESIDITDGPKVPSGSYFDIIYTMEYSTYGGF
jgi:hypothetical protein